MNTMTARYYAEVYKYIREQISRKVKNYFLQSLIALIGTLVVLIIKTTSRYSVKVLCVISLVLLAYFSSHYIAKYSCFIYIFVLIPFAGELAMLLVKITGTEEKQPYITMLIRGVQWSSRLRSCGFPVFIGKNVKIYQPNKVSIGSHVSIYDGVIISAGNGEVVIGSNTHIDAYSVIRGDGGVYIGNYCAIASGVKIYSISNQAKEKNKLIIEQPLIRAPVVIEDDVWIGANAVILPGVKVRRGAVIGAGAVVPIGKILECNTIYVGVPARPLKKRVNKNGKVNRYI